MLFLPTEFEFRVVFLSTECKFGSVYSDSKKRDLQQIADRTCFSYFNQNQKEFQTLLLQWLVLRCTLQCTIDYPNHLSCFQCRLLKRSRYLRLSTGANVAVSWSFSALTFASSGTGTMKTKRSWRALWAWNTRNGDFFFN